jgi:hypothetical protein
MSKLLFQGCRRKGQPIKGTMVEKRFFLKNKMASDNVQSHFVDWEKPNPLVESNINHKELKKSKFRMNIGASILNTNLL